MADRAPVPRAAALLGGAGLLPAVLGLLAYAWAPGDPALALLAVLAYAAVILSFLGGTWWGFAVARLQGTALLPWLVLAVLPSLIAWPSLFLGVARPRLGGALLGVALVATLLGDRRLVLAGLAPDWWLRLRVPLSCGLAVAAIAAGWPEGR